MRAVFGLPSQSTGPTPASDSIQLIAPRSAWYIHCHTSATATIDDAYGRKTAVRARRAAHVRRPSARATPSANTIVTGTVRVESAVLRSEIHTAGSRTSWAKLA